tara:strand:- start:777 stop:938 length:162 start_codon:yes stop_codon:yes gene_type:complete
MKYTITDYLISVQWNDNPKLQTLHNNMPDHLCKDFDKWLSSIEHERNTIEGGN